MASSPADQYQQGMALLRAGQLKEALHLFNTLLGSPYPHWFKAPEAQPRTFEGLSLTRVADLYRQASLGAAYCCVRLGFCEDAIRFADMHRSAAMTETMQLGRQPVSGTAALAMLKAERQTLKKLEALDQHIRGLERSPVGGGDEIAAARQQAADLLRSLNDTRLEIYADWKREQQEGVWWGYHTVFDEYDSWSQLWWSTVHYEVWETTATLYYLYYPATEELAVIAIRGWQETSHDLKPLPAAVLDRLRQRCQQAMLAADSAALTGVARDLDVWLLPPASLLDGIEHLIIVPDSVLEWVPWEMLGASRDQPLGLACGVARSPSLELFRIAAGRGTQRETAQRASRGQSLSAVLFGNPTGDLLWAEDEVREAAGLLAARGAKAQAHTGQQASVEAFMAIDPSVDIVHLACHAGFHPEDPMLSHARLSDGILLPRAVEGRGYVSAPLCILSACESGVIASAAGEMLGLIRGFLAGGGSAVVATGWKVSDWSAKELVLTFYAGLLDGQTAAQALRSARQHICNDPRWQGDPLHWAAYTLIGSPFRRLAWEQAQATDIDLWGLLQAIGGPDERLSWQSAHALSDAIQNDAGAVQTLLVEGFAEQYDDWEPELILPRLEYFVREGVIDRETIEDALSEAADILAEKDDYGELYKVAWPDLLDTTLSNLRRGKVWTDTMKGPFSPAVRSLLPGVDISDDYLEVDAADHHLIRKLAGALTSRDSSLRWAAAEALVNIAAFNDYDIATEPLLGALEQALRSEDARVRRKARSGLVEGENEEIVAMLGRVLDSPSTEVCHDAVRGLAEIARQRDIGEGSGCWWPFLATLGDALAAALRHPDPAVRAAATEPFAGLAAESPEAAGERAGLLLDHPDPAVRRAVMASLQDFGEGAYDDTGLDVLLGALAKALDDADDEVKRAARAALDPRRWEDPAPLVKFLRRRAASPGAAGQQAARELLRGLDG